MGSLIVAHLNECFPFGLSEYHFFSKVNKSTHLPHQKTVIVYYYIDRCELWGFIHEINSGISHVKYQFFPAETTFAKL